MADIDCPYGPSRRHDGRYPCASGASSVRARCESAGAIFLPDGPRLDHRMPRGTAPLPPDRAEPGESLQVVEAHGQIIIRITPAACGGLDPKCDYQVPGRILRPAEVSLRKSSGFAVASDASQRIVVAAIMQSAIEPRRRPPRLKRRADSSASSALNGTRSAITRLASWTSCSSTGPHRNSAQTTALTPSKTRRRSQSRNCLSADVPGTKARISKLVSR